MELQDGGESVYLEADGLRGRLLVMAGVVAAPFVIMGYLGLAVVVVLPLLGLRRIFPRRLMASILLAPARA